MNSRHPIRLCVAALLVGAPVCSAQEAGGTTPAPWEHHAHGAPATLSRSARENAEKMDAEQRVRDARIRRVTRSICAGCSGDANRPRRAASGAGDEPRPRDPAQAPED